MSARHDQPARAISAPAAGLFKMRLVRGGPFIAAELRVDQHGRLIAVIDGQEQPRTHPDPAADDAIMRVWTSGITIPADEHSYLLALGEWARKHAPGHPAASPRRQIALVSMPPVF